MAGAELMLNLSLFGRVPEELACPIRQGSSQTPSWKGAVKLCLFVGDKLYMQIIHEKE